MKKARHPQVKFKVSRVDGHFTDKGWHNKGGITFWKKTQALKRAIQVISQHRAVYIKVFYGKQLYNDGIYDNQKDLKEALSAFTEQSLIDYALEGK